MEGQTYLDVNICEDLSVTQKQRVKDLVTRYKHMFTELPGCTTLETHKVKLTSDTPVSAKPYPIPFAMRDAFLYVYMTLFICWN